jgi:hypothetical protein
LAHETESSETIRPRDKEDRLSRSNFIVAPASRQQFQPDRRKDNTPHWKKRAEIAAMIIALGLLIVNIFQMSATQRAADSAEKSAKVADFALKITGRAYVGPESGNGVDFVRGSVGHIDMIVRNTGHTPALDYGAVGYDGFVGRNEKIPELIAPMSPVYVPTTIEPGSGKLVSSAILHGEQVQPILGEEHIKSLRNGDSRYYFFVFIWYKDVFPDTVPHRTRFCREIQPNLFNTQPCQGIPDYSD